MAQTITGIGTSKIINALDTYNHTVKSNSMYTISIRLTEMPADAVTVVLSNNSTTLATSTTPAGASLHIELAATVNCAINDVLSCVISSAAATAAAPNKIKAILTIREGTI